MGSTTTTIQSLFDNFIDQSNDWRFFLGLAEYKDYLNKTPETEEILNTIMKDREKLYKQHNEVEKQMLLEINKTANELKEIILENKWEYPDLTNKIEEYVNYQEGKIQSTAPLSTNLYHCIVTMISLLKEKGHEESVSHLYETFPDDPKHILRHNFAPSRDEHEKIKKEIETKKETSLWGAVEEIELCRWVIYEARDYYNEIAQDREKFFEVWNVDLFLEDMDHIREFGHPKNNATHFKKDKYSFDAKRVHQHIVNQVSKERTPYKKRIGSLSYKDGFLYIDGISIEIARDADSNQHEILETFDNDFSTPRGNDEVWEQVYKTDYVKEEWRKLYRAVNEINRKIKDATQKDKFFIASSKQIRTNPKYLK